jgi:DEAD/DEAH box helicase domain-containing protein
MLHFSMLPGHVKWERFFRTLKHVVIDEAHTYRGVFGSHVAMILRRLVF